MTRGTLERFGDIVAKGVPLGRVGTPEELAGVAIFLASRASAHVNTTVTPVDGASTETK
ncbi:MAG: SDR family oxidoreductase [bacterium]|nr:SDR family oxidoreductase [bacterium]